MEAIETTRLSIPKSVAIHGDEVVGFTDDIVLPERVVDGYTLRVWVSLEWDMGGRYKEIRQRYRYMVIAPDGRMVSDQRGLYYISPDGAYTSALNCANHHRRR